MHQIDFRTFTPKHPWTRPLADFVFEREGFSTPILILGYELLGFFSEDGNISAETMRELELDGFQYQIGSETAPITPIPHPYLSFLLNLARDIWPKMAEGDASADRLLEFLMALEDGRLTEDPSEREKGDWLSDMAAFDSLFVEAANRVGNMLDAENVNIANVVGAVLNELSNSDQAAESDLYRLTLYAVDRIVIWFIRSISTPIHSDLNYYDFPAASMEA